MRCAEHLPLQSNRPACVEHLPQHAVPKNDPVERVGGATFPVSAADGFTSNPQKSMINSNDLCTTAENQDTRQAWREEAGSENTGPGKKRRADEREGRQEGDKNTEPGRAREDWRPTKPQRNVGKALQWRSTDLTMRAWTAGSARIATHSAAESGADPWLNIERSGLLQRQLVWSAAAS